MSTGLLAFGLWILFCAVVVGGILWVLSLMVEVEEDECPLGKDCAIETTKKKEMNKRIQSKLKGVSKKKVPGSDGVIHTEEYYDTERNK